MGKSIYDEFADRLEYLVERETRAAAIGVNVTKAEWTAKGADTNGRLWVYVCEPIENAGRAMLADALASYDTAAARVGASRAKLREQVIGALDDFLALAKLAHAPRSPLGASSHETVFGVNLGGVSERLRQEINQHLGSFGPKKPTWFDAHPRMAKVLDRAFWAVAGSGLTLLAKCATG